MVCGDLLAAAVHPAVQYSTVQYRVWYTVHSTCSTRCPCPPSRGWTPWARTRECPGGSWLMVNPRKIFGDLPKIFTWLGVWGAWRRARGCRPPPWCPWWWRGRSRTWAATVSTTRLNILVNKGQRAVVLFKSSATDYFRLVDRRLESNLNSILTFPYLFKLSFSFCPWGLYSQWRMEVSWERDYLWKHHRPELVVKMFSHCHGWIISRSFVPSYLTQHLLF